MNQPRPLRSSWRLRRRGVVRELEIPFRPGRRTSVGIGVVPREPSHLLRAQRSPRSWRRLAIAFGVAEAGSCRCHWANLEVVLIRAPAETNAKVSRRDQLEARCAAGPPWPAERAELVRLVRSTLRRLTRDDADHAAPHRPVGHGGCPRGHLDALDPPRPHSGDAVVPAYAVHRVAIHHDQHRCLPRPPQGAAPGAVLAVRPPAVRSTSPTTVGCCWRSCVRATNESACGDS